MLVEHALDLEPPLRLVAHEDRDPGEGSLGAAGEHETLGRALLEKAAKELLEQQWKKTTMAKLPEATELLGSSQRIG